MKTCSNANKRRRCKVGCQPQEAKEFIAWNGAETEQCATCRRAAREYARKKKGKSPKAILDCPHKYSGAGLSALCVGILKRAVQDATKENGENKSAVIWLTRSKQADVYFDYIDVERQYIIQQMRKRGINGF